MTFEFDKPAPPSKGVHVAQRVLRVTTILVAVFGIGFLGWRWLNPPERKAPPPAPAANPAAAPASSTDETEEEYDLNLGAQTVRRPGEPEVAPPTESAENSGTTGAVVGMDEVKDGALIEPSPLYWLLREAGQNYPPDNLWMKRLEPTKLEELRARPQDFRGKPVCVRGVVARVEGSSLQENPSGISYVLEGEVIVPGEGVCMFVSAKAVGVRPGMAIELRGLFMKLVTYKSVGGKMEQAPLVVVSQPVLASGAPASAAPASSTGGAGSAMLVGILVVLFVAYLGLQFAMRRKGAGTNRAIEARRKAREMLGRPMHEEDFVPPTESDGDRKP